MMWERIVVLNKKLIFLCFRMTAADLAKDEGDTKMFNYLKGVEDAFQYFNFQSSKSK